MPTWSADRTTTQPETAPRNRHNRRMRALRIFAGPAALRHIQQNGLLPGHVGAIPAAAGGPKGLILLGMDRFIFGEWLAQSSQPVDLIGASIGAWRMATACLQGAAQAFRRLEHDYIHQHYDVPPGQGRPSARQVSQTFRANLDAFYGGRVGEVLGHPRWRLHIVTSRGKGLLERDGRLRTPLGYAAAYLANAAGRQHLGRWLERVVFSSAGGPLPFETPDLPTQEVPLTADNFMEALQASCSIPFVLEPVAHISGAPSGAYWDGGITDYHLHLHYRYRADAPLVLYPHFQQAVVPGWLDKSLKRRHRSTSALDNMVVLAPNPAWVQRLPGAKLPDRTDFTRYGPDLAGRVAAWQAATAASQQLVDEWQAWLARPDPTLVQPL